MVANDVQKIIKEMKIEDVPEAIAKKVSDTVAAKVLEIQNAIGGGSMKDKFTPAIKNKICAAILKAGNKQEVENAVMKVIIENQITGIVFGDVIDYTIATKWQNNNALYAKLHQTMVTKFHYTDSAMNDVANLAKQWSKSNAKDENGVWIEKSIQEVTATPKSIATSYVYKRQQVDFEDLDDIEKVGQLSNFLTWVTTELQQQVVNTIIMAILVGDAINVVGERISTFETIGTKLVTDIFTYVTSVDDDAVTVGSIRAMCDRVLNPNGKEKILIIKATLLTALSGYTYAAGGDVYYRTIEEMAGQFGVSSIYVTDLIGDNKVICIIPDGYWVNEKKALSIAYPSYEKNRQNYQVERNTGGAIHDLLSTGLLKINATS
jgi:hypothetical protein